MPVRKQAYIWMNCIMLINWDLYVTYRMVNRVYLAIISGYCLAGGVGVKVA